MLPLSLLNTAVGHPILVELKNGETYNGHLEKCDNFMNIILREVIQTDSDGDRFWRLPEVYIRGNTIKYLRIPDAVLDKVKEDMATNRSQGTRGGRGGRGRGGRGGDSSSRGRGRGRGRGGGGDGSHSGVRGGRHVN
ncbi:Sm-like ribonucleo protein [Coemansia reversa NRRL 1564]|uniref:LSM complex subunit LSM4 n=1 Tax=Coemansia reversa (strain ATCC 12441 / NRRL 1564) TaxID=763665 RepID=A0A2G5BKW4_COERN|nr:Sm-like ribonucleo protein [Coemansia reversa NRRL 1564]|eukprot:PIA19631.1 Sm-like ribonucleo protein [Coemansia reversa NRRL 1564]